MGPATHQTRRQVTQLRQFDLQLAFKSARTLRENIKNQADTIQHPTFQPPLQIAFLRRAERVIDNNQVGFVFGAQRGDFIDLSRSNQETRVRAPQPCRRLGDTLCACGYRQFLELGYLIFKPGAGALHVNEDISFTETGTVKHSASDR